VPVLLELRPLRRGRSRCAACGRVPLPRSSSPDDPLRQLRDLRLGLPVERLLGQLLRLGQAGQGFVEIPRLVLFGGLAPEPRHLLGEALDLVLALDARPLGLGVRAQLVQLRPQVSLLLDLPLGLLQVEEANRAVVVPERQVALALVEVGQVVDELETVGLLLERGVGLGLDRLLEVRESLGRTSWSG
jgi:hypothetical protein